MHVQMVQPHILPHPTILRVVNTSWNTLWTTKIGRKPLHTFHHLDAQVIGKFFQEIMAHELYTHDPHTWADPQAPRSVKLPDFVCTTDPCQSFELKMCGQHGSRVVYGNRCSSSEYASPNGKSRDGYLLTINYTATRINLIRFGYILGSDWIGQKSSSGNAAHLTNNVYETKLHVVKGEYQLLADPTVLKGIGSKTRFKTVGEVYAATPPTSKLHLEAHRFLHDDFYY